VPRRAQLVLVALATVVVCALAVVGSRPPGARALPHPEPSPLAEAEGAACVEYETKVNYGALGYDHRVVLTSSCEDAATCTVTTDVNPDPQTVDVPAGQSVTVLTFRGSPASEFTATVRCTLD